MLNITGATLPVSIKSSLDGLDLYSCFSQSHPLLLVGIRPVWLVHIWNIECWSLTSEHHWCKMCQNWNELPASFYLLDDKTECESGGLCHFQTKAVLYGENRRYHLLCLNPSHFTPGFVSISNPPPHFLPHPRLRRILSRWSGPGLV